MKSISSTIAASLWISLAGAPAGHAQSTAADLRGVFVYSNNIPQATPSELTQLSTALALPGVDGMATVFGWADLEPARGQYQWTVLDQWIGKVAAAGRKIDLVVTAGNDTPAWLFQAPPTGGGAKALTFNTTSDTRANGICKSTTIASPWDSAFLSQWDAMLSALSAHLKSTGSYSAITLLRLTGINQTTEELRLPVQSPANTAPCVTDAIALWQSAGYKPSLLLQGWNSILASFQKYFPDKSFSLSLIPFVAFPGIAEDGSLLKGTVPDRNAPLLAAAAQKFPGHLVIQFDSLLPNATPEAEVAQSAQNLGSMAAFQTNEYLGGTGLGGAGCSPEPTPIQCTPALFLNMLEEGIYPLGRSNPLRSQYIEIFRQDATAFPDSVLQAHFELLPPAVTLVANAEGESPTIAPNTWVEIKGSGLSLTGDARVWAGGDFSGGQMPRQLDNISVTVNGRPAYVYYISPGQINILTPPDAMAGPVPVQVTVNGVPSASFTAQAQPLSPSFFVFNGGPYVAATHANGSLLGPATLYPGATTPAKPGETIVLYANGFGPTPTPVVAGSVVQSGVLSPAPTVKIGGLTATVQFAGLISPGEFQFNIVVPNGTPDGDQPVVASYNGASTQSNGMISIQH